MLISNLLIKANVKQSSDATNVSEHPDVSWTRFPLYIPDAL